MSRGLLEAHIEQTLAAGVLPAADLLARVGLSSGQSHATIRRALVTMGDRILPMGSARARRYGLSRAVVDAGTTWCIAKVDEGGRPALLGDLHAMASGQWYVDPARGVDSTLLWWGSDRGVFDGLPWYLDTLRPQGFLGRVFGASASSLLPGVPADINVWSDDHVLRAASALGSDLPGNLVVGDAIIDVSFSRRSRPVDHPPLRSLPEWADAVTAGLAVGSSAGGEQPKFVLPLDPDTGSLLPRIVKFSPPLDTPGGRRWGDLLIAEHVANTTLSRHGFEVAITRVHHQGGRLYLEGDRFDRTPGGGRRGFCHLSAPAASAGANLDDWNASTTLLVRDGLLPAETTQRVAFLHAFGRAIGNTDMHHGNLGLLGSPESGWRLSPVYDMLPMRYAPGRTLEVTPGLRETPLDAPPDVRLAASEFWRTLSTHPLLSPEFSAIAASHAARLESAPAAPLRPRRSL